MFEIIPFKVVGPIRFNSAIDTLVEAHAGIKAGSAYKKKGWESWSFFDSSLLVHTSRGKVRLIQVQGPCAIESEPVQGQRLYDFFDRYQVPDTEQWMTDTLYLENGEQRELYDIPSMGMQLWVDAQERIETVLCYGK